MSTATLDTLRIANRLKAVGVPDKQAELEAEILKETLDASLNDLMTETAMRRELLLLEQRITLKFGAMLAAAVGIIIAVLRIPS